MVLRNVGKRAVNQHPKTMLEFFAGIGLVHEALRQSGWQCIYANDLDPYKRALYEANFGSDPSESLDYWHLEDVWNTASVVGRVLANADSDQVAAPLLATASFPCTDMSLAGNMKGFSGRESSAFFGFAEVLEQLGERKPPLVLLENVVGLLTARGGRDFVAAVDRLAELGYWLDCWRLDAKHFVPQSRPRLFIAGFLHPEHYLPEGARPALPAATSALRPARLLEAVQACSPSTGWILAPLPDPPAPKTCLSDWIDRDDRQDWWPAEQVARHMEMLSDSHRQQVEQRQDSREPWVATAFRRIREGQQRLEVRFDGIAGCLRTPKGGSARQIVLAGGSQGQRMQGQHMQGLRMRWMSPREYARLQGASDYNWGEAADSRVLFGFGDAVCVPAIAWIDRHVLTPYIQRLADSRLSV
ncbi:MAG: DNA (cytosine-5-)-methyltransferase [Planctomycetales bacterium]|nr:DNA (cytosine-5-)-methyltransferase [Planctomycetales bacterium]